MPLELNGMDVSGAMCVYRRGIMGAGDIFPLDFIL